MKKIIGFICASLVGFSAFAYDITEDTKIIGSVKSVTKTVYSISSKFGEYYRTPSVKFLTNFDASGRQLESLELTPRDAVVNKVQNTYDAYGNLLEKSAYDPEGVLLWKSVSTYDGTKNKETTEYSKDGSMRNKIIYSYDDNSVDETFYDSEGTIVRKIVYYYGVNGLLEKEMEYFGDGTLDTVVAYEYGETGKISKIITTTQGSTTLMDVFYYTKDGLSEVATYDSSNVLITRKIVKCDASGNIIKVTTYSVGNKFGKTMNEMTEMVEFSYQY